MKRSDLRAIDFLGLDRVLRRGSGEITSEEERALLVYDRVSGAHLLACGDGAAGEKLLERRAWDCALLMVSDYALGLKIFEKYGFSEKLVCRQVAYFGEKPAQDGRLSVRTATEKDLPMLTKHYDLISEKELESVVSRGSVLLGYRENCPVGFVGEHLEGSMGLLYVFPEFRRRGFGGELQKQMIAKTMEEGFVPFGQVEKDNRASLALQKKLGMTLSDRLIVWMWRRD